ncbi:ArdC-like ssDNA-binding domain-containing protein [Enterococcus faecium]|uniref:ArdC-like ssDNA-binding domain-containing protein n=1 Tax=Enterococcus faecium TaxID=1352 RepID=UPI00225BDB01|nr:ArdC-like ssDNA-binding domain-containing protein [Enterococcus faecium]MCX3905396.1 ArdC-like ssDNA-binding domain-containing protein [Enterococcus faecium]MCX4003091.1 ArdC-like ssDNA-binding domain-containing protein [Enterococcus faecium]
MSYKDSEAKKNNKTAELLSQAEEGIKEVLSSDKYKNFLRVMSKFHNYSLNNTLLILMQNPNATHVAGYKTWKNSFNRQVNKGEKSIKIIGGRPYKRKVEEIKNGQKEEKEVEGISFFPVSVFDVSQTSGEPLPQLMNELSGEVKNYPELYVALKQSTNFSIEFADIQGGTKGYCSPLEKKIVLNNGMSQAQTIKTLIHEITHADLHAPEFDKNSSIRTTKSTKEVEAESTAFVVCEHYGIDTKDYSFPYLAAWSRV